MEGNPEPRPTQPADVDPAEATINPTQTVVVEFSGSAAQPVETATPAEGASEKKSKKGLIIGVIIGAIILIGGAITAAVLALTSNKPDVVALAIQRIMNGETPANLAIDGGIDIHINSEGAPIKRINVGLDSAIITESLINKTTASLTLTDSNNEEIDVTVDEVYAADGDLFIKVDGLSDIFEASGLFNLPTMTGDIIGEETVTVSSLIKGVDDEWIRISLDEISEISKSYVSEESPLSCLSSVASNLSKNTNTAAEIYGKYPFISSTTEGVTLSGRQGPVYLVSFDSKNFANYISSLNDSLSDEGLFSCLGYKKGARLNEEEIDKMFSEIPKIYVEVNENHDFSRLYLETDLNEGQATVAIDLDFSYPANVNVSEVPEYTTLTDLLEELTVIMGGDIDIVVDE